MITTTVLSAVAAILLLALCAMATLWRAEFALHRRSRRRLRAQIDAARRDSAEWRTECGRLNTWAQDLHDRLQAATVQRDGYRQRLESLTVGAALAPDTVDEAEAAAGMQRDLIRIARLPETPESWTGGDR